MDNLKLVMKENRLSIQINKPADQIFEFTINPVNTHKWFDSIKQEVTNEYPPKLGTIYTNCSESQTWSSFKVTGFISNELFELTSADDIYHVRYKYNQLSHNQTKVEYFEWVDTGELEVPANISVLVKLKSILENNN